MTGQNSFLRNITMLFSVFIRHTVSTSAFALGAFIIVPATAYAAESGYITPLTEFGAPDLQGTWSLATQTNLERSDRFEGKLVISQEEALLNRGEGAGA